MLKILMRVHNYRIKAFTLIEALLTLFVISMILMICSTSVNKSVENLKSELFIYRFEQIYREVQFESMSKKTSNSLKITEGNLEYFGKKIYIPKEVEFKDDYIIKFNENGATSRLEKIVIYIPSKKKEISYQLLIGSGKYKKKIS